jgi:hypothetical protein
MQVPAPQGAGESRRVDWYDTVFEVIDLRSFSNLWFWIAVAVLWSSASHWVVGVPWDLVQRARRAGGEAEADVMALVGIYTRRILFVARVSGLWLVGLTAFLLTGLALLGFLYAVEFAQALLLLAAPMTLVGALTLRTARRLAEEQPEPEMLYRRLLRHRMAVQGIGMVAIFVTAVWGMWQNMNIGVL